MKQSFLLLFFFAFTLQLNAQITVERSDFLLELGDTTFFWNAVTPDDVPAPKGGENQVWDYSNITYDTDLSWFFTHTAGTDSNFPNANIVNNTNISSGIIPNLELPVAFVSQLDDQGLRTLGRVDEPAPVPLESLTGSATDSINFTKTVSIYEDPSIKFYFPMNYADNNVANFVLKNNFLLTVAAFGLDHVPGKAQYTGVETRNVIGWGTLKMPNVDNGGIVEKEVLLLEEISNFVDSFFLAGAPAPAALLGAFNLTQGRTRSDTTYFFTAKGLSTNLMEIAIASDGSRTVRINREVPGLVSSIRQVKEAFIPITLFPNPSNGDFYLDFEKTEAQAWSLSVFNALGQMVSEQSIQESRGALRQAISLSGNADGIYHFILRNSEGQIVGSDQLILKQ